MKPKLLYTVSARYTRGGLETLKEHFKIVTVRSIDELKIHLVDSEVLIASLEHYYDQQLLELGQKLKYILTNTTGTNHIEISERSNIKLIYLKNRELIQNITTTAELALALILACFRNLQENMEKVKNGVWDRYHAPGTTFVNKTIAIVGIGRLGSKVAEFCTNLGMKVIFFDPYKTDVRYVRYNTLEDLVREADVVSIHAILTPETEGMIDSALLSFFTKGSILVNTARGEIIDEDALIQYLDNGTIAAAGLDVIQNEQAVDLFSTSKILQYAKQHPNVLITPHIGGACEEARYFTENIVIEKLLEHYKS